MISTYSIFLEMSRRDFLRKSLFGGAAAATAPVMKVAKHFDYTNKVKPSKIEQLNHDAGRVEHFTGRKYIQNLDPLVGKVNKGARWIKKITDPVVKSHKNVTSNLDVNRRDVLKSGFVFGPELIGASGVASIVANKFRRIARNINPLPTSVIKTPGLEPTRGMKFLGFEGDEINIKENKLC